MLLLNAGLAVAAVSPTPVTQLMSTAPRGGQADGPSSDAAISADARFVAFDSQADNLVPGDTNERSDIFLRDRASGTLTRISTGWNGSQANGASWCPALSADGRSIAFVSRARNLVRGDDNHSADVFVYDRRTHRTTRESVRSDGGEATAGQGGSWFCPAISADGRFLAFATDAGGLGPTCVGSNGWPCGIVLRDRVARRTFTVDDASKSPFPWLVDVLPTISADGRYVRFRRAIDGSDEDGYDYVLLQYDRLTGAITHIVDTMWEYSFSADDRYLAYHGDGRRVYVLDRTTRHNTLIRLPAWSDIRDLTISGDGGSLIYSRLTRVLRNGNLGLALYRTSLQTGGTQRLSIPVPPRRWLVDWPPPPGDWLVQHRLAPSFDASFVAFTWERSLMMTDRNDVGDVYLRGPLAG
jgi:Tol biopolymer transport system component